MLTCWTHGGYIMKPEARLNGPRWLSSGEAQILRQTKEDRAVLSNLGHHSVC